MTFFFKKTKSLANNPINTSKPKEGATASAEWNPLAGNEKIPQNDHL